MKYLQDDRLAALTGILTECPIRPEITSQSQRCLYGRLEAYTMKRTGADKKYAFKLGEQYVAWQESLEKDYWTSYHELFLRDPLGNPTSSSESLAGRKRSQSAGVFEDISTSVVQPHPLKWLRKNRAQSFDLLDRRARHFAESGSSITFKTKPQKAKAKVNNVPPTLLVETSLGDFSAQSTRRLMTDLILTLNLSFPDYDFSSARPNDFVHASILSTVQKINQQLADISVPPIAVKSNRLSKKMALNAAPHKPARQDFVTELWSAVDDVMSLADCEVYSYQPEGSTQQEDDDNDPLGFLTQTLLSSGNASSMRAQVVEPDAEGMSGSTSIAGPQDVATAAASPSTVLWSFNYLFVNKSRKRIMLFACIETMKLQSPRVRDDDEYGYDTTADETIYLNAALNEHADEDIEEGEGDDDDEEDRFGSSSAAMMRRESFASSMMSPVPDDFDMDPAASTAGGIPISST